MVAILRLSAPHGVLAILLLTVVAFSADGQTTPFTWNTQGTFRGTFFSATAEATFTSSGPFNLGQSHVQLTGQPASATDWRLLGNFEITAANGDRLLGNYDTTGMRNGFFFTGPFRFTGGTGRFFGATGQGTIDNIVTMYEPLPAPSVAGTVETEWRGTITLVPATVPGDYNQNGTVDAADYVMWRKNDGTQAGYDVWRANFGATAAVGAASGAASTDLVGARPPRLGEPTAAVPEPSALAVSTLAIPYLAAWAIRRRRVQCPFSPRM
jgi:hypothetical protein